jgi:hypothetical protein
MHVIDDTGKTKGWCLHALWCSLYAFLRRTQGYAKNIDKIIRMGGMYHL